MQSWNESDIPDLSDKRILITGGASGIGLEAARTLARRGAELILADKNEQAGALMSSQIAEETPGARARFLPLDLGRLGAVHDFAAALLAEGRPIDILINNAGIQPISERRTSADGFELTFGIGHIGHFALTGLLLPLVESGSEPRIVTVSSLVHGQGWFDWNDLQMERGYKSQRAYNQTKLANLLFAQELQRRIGKSGRKVSSIAVHPGVARTSIGANRKQLGQFRLGDHMVSAILSVVMPWLGQSAADGALPTLYGATAPHARGGGFYGPGGFGEMKGAPGPARIKPAGQDEQAATRLWTQSEDWTGVRYPF